MAKICVAVFSTKENGRLKYTRQTLNCLLETVDFKRHELFISDNGSSQETHQYYEEFKEEYTYQYPLENLTIHFNGINKGTAKAINEGIKTRKPNQHICKCDDDVNILSAGWLDLLEEGIERMPDKLALLCLKRNDLEERPDHENDWYKSKLIYLPHERGQKWLCAEIVSHAMGTVQLYNHRFLDKINCLEQMSGLYGFDDSISGVKAQVAGMLSAFLVGVEIVHLDEGGTDYTKWKMDYADKMMSKFGQYKMEYLNGTRDIYTPFE